MTTVADPYPLEMLEVDGIVLQGASGQPEHYILDQERELLEMVEHPSLGQHIDEVRRDVHAVGRAAVLSVSSTLQEYINGACMQHILPTLAHYRERGFLIQIAFVGKQNKAA